MLPFNVPCCTGQEKKYLRMALQKKKLCGDNDFTKRCQQWIEKTFNCRRALLTTSGTHALELAALLTDIQPGDEVIMPSYTFCSTANAFVMRGAKVVFVDIRPDTMNIDEKLIEEAITPRTRVIVPVHYAGISCEMDAIMRIAKRHNIFVVEDAAQGVMAQYKNKYLGTISDIGCFSFHETKNYTCGEGGAILLNKAEYEERAEIIREKGTNRSQFFRGEIDKYSWVDVGSSYLPSELNAAYLYAQFELAHKINDDRMRSWKTYDEGLADLRKRGIIELPVVPDRISHNAHMFYVKVKDLNERSALIDHLRKNDIYSVFHYVPLHSAAAGLRFGRFNGEDRYTTRESDRLLRLPLYYGLKRRDVLRVIEFVKKFYDR